MNPLTPKQFYHNFKRICDLRDLPMKEVLRPAGVHEGYPSRWQHNNEGVKGKLPDYRQLAIMARVLGCSLEDLAFGYHKSQAVRVPLQRYKEMERMILNISENASALKQI